VGGYAQLCANDFTDKSTKILFTDPALHQQPLCDLDALREPPSPDNNRSYLRFMASLHLSRRWVGRSVIRRRRVGRG
jgi:hypothetical protein